MTILAGSKLGPYEVLSPLGAGGMGEVYRARDSRLAREVAIKVLPASFSNDPDRLRRFEQEAKAAGLLNHPNITAVYDIGSHEGAPYVVSELLEGETLRAVLAGGRLSPRKAIDYALQMAHGLAAAHEKGIVHRDLKPENLFVTKDGRVKILDFGLAKLTHAEEGQGEKTNLPTAAAATEPGVVLGTLGYMAPEQVRGTAGRRAQRHLLLRRDPLRDALGQARLPRRLRRGHDVGDPAGRSARPLRDEPESRPRPRADRPALPGEEPRAAFPLGPRSRLRSRVAVGALRAGSPADRCETRLDAARRSRRRGRGDPRRGRRSGLSRRPARDRTERGAAGRPLLLAADVPAAADLQRAFRARREDGGVQRRDPGEHARDLLAAPRFSGSQRPRALRRPSAFRILEGRAGGPDPRPLPRAQPVQRDAGADAARGGGPARDPGGRARGRLVARRREPGRHPRRQREGPAGVPRRQGPLRGGRIL